MIDRVAVVLVCFHCSRKHKRIGSPIARCKGHIIIPLIQHLHSGKQRKGVTVHAQTKSLNCIRALWEILLSPSCVKKTNFNLWSLCSMHTCIYACKCLYPEGYKWFALYLNSWGFIWGQSIYILQKDSSIFRHAISINACTCLTSVSCASVRGVCVCVRSQSNNITGLSQSLMLSFTENSLVDVTHLQR